MKYPKDFFVEILDYIESAEGKTHFIPAASVISHYYKDTAIIDNLCKLMVYTNNPGFQTFSNLRLSYILKPKYSASKAIVETFEKYETVVDCGNTLVFMHYYAILKSMMALHGDVEGCKRFDAIFGSASELTPSHQRLKVIHNSYKGERLGEYQQLVDGDKGQLLEPLVITKTLKRYEKVEEMLKNLKIGSSLHFQGDRDSYNKVHPAGMDGGYNCIVVNINPIQVRTFGYTDSLSLEDLKRLHITAFKAPLSIDDQMIFMWRDDSKQVIDKLNHIREKGPQQMNGIIAENTHVEDYKVEILLKAPIVQIQKIMNIKFNCMANSSLNEGDVSEIMYPMMMYVYDALPNTSKADSSKVELFLDGLLERTNSTNRILNALELDMKRKLSIKSDEKAISDQTKKSTIQSRQSSSSNSNSNSNLKEDMSWVKKGFLLRK